MKITLAAIADAATVDQSGKLSLIGTFDTINMQKIPGAHAPWALAVRFHLDPIDANQDHEILIRLVDEDGNISLEGKAGMRAGNIGPGEFSSPAVAITLPLIPFMRAGRYHFEITGRDVSVEVPFLVKQAGSTA